MMLNTVISIASMGVLDTVSLYIDPTAITTSLVSASGIIIALGASAGVIIGKMTTASATLNVFFSKLGRVIFNVFGVLDNGGRELEGDISRTHVPSENSKNKHK